MTAKAVTTVLVGLAPCLVAPDRAPADEQASPVAEVASSARAPYTIKTLKWGELKAGAGRAIFKPEGDRLTIIDYEDDGRAVEVYLGGKEPRYYDPDPPSGRGFNYDFPEGKRIKFNICLSRRGEIEDGTCAYSTVTT
ncbi:hypothetical protein [Streptomyces acidicola]|uniref:hypothetical protein n=1 Tax=Streptomyces acidicola TaxID=2596892 RepID=UPI0037F84976